MKILNNLAMMTVLSGMVFGCNSSIQTSSGYGFNADVPKDNQHIRQAAGVEPLLRFPAKFCVAKMERSLMAYTAPNEMNTWYEIAKRHQDWGQFSEVSPAVINLVQSQRIGRQSGKIDISGVMLGAARQHCNAVLTYELRGDTSNVMANATLIDTKNGYVYLTASKLGKTEMQAFTSLANEVEIAMSALAKALN